MTVERITQDIISFTETSGYAPGKTIKLFGSVDQSMLNVLVCNLLPMDSVSGRITMYLYSEGGEIDVARAMYDLIKQCNNRVRIVCLGVVASAATIILQAADERVMTPNSKLMLHLGEEGISINHPRSVEASFVEYRKDEDWFLNIYLKRIKEVKKRFTKEQLKDMLIFDKYFSPKEAMEIGLIDEIQGDI